MYVKNTSLDGYVRFAAFPKLDFSNYPKSARHLWLKSCLLPMETMHRPVLSVKMDASKTALSAGLLMPLVDATASITPP